MHTALFASSESYPPIPDWCVSVRDDAGREVHERSDADFLGGPDVLELTGGTTGWQVRSLRSGPGRPSVPERYLTYAKGVLRRRDRLNRHGFPIGK